MSKQKYKNKQKMIFFCKTFAMELLYQALGLKCQDIQFILKFLVSMLATRDNAFFFTMID